MVDFPSYEQWKRLTDEQRDYLLWETLSTTRQTLANLPQLYARKQVERIVYGFITLVMTGVSGAIINLVIKK